MINKEVLMNDLILLSRNFYKIIEVDLNEDTYFEVKVDDDQPHVYTGLQKWVKAFGPIGVHPSDQERFYAFFDVEKLKKNTDHWQRIYYRRKINDEWRMVCMEVIPLDNYSEEDAIVLMVVRDIQDYLKDYKEQILPPLYDAIHDYFKVPPRGEFMEYLRNVVEAQGREYYEILDTRFGDDLR